MSLHDALVNLEKKISAAKRFFLEEKYDVADNLVQLARNELSDLIDSMPQSAKKERIKLGALKVGLDSAAESENILNILTETEKILHVYVGCDHAIVGTDAQKCVHCYNPGECIYKSEPEQFNLIKSDIRYSGKLPKCEKYNKINGHRGRK